MNHILAITTINERIKVLTDVTKSLKETESHNPASLILQVTNDIKKLQNSITKLENLS